MAPIQADPARHASTACALVDEPVTQAQTECALVVEIGRAHV
jgi:hypothetical protein